MFVTMFKADSYNNSKIKYMTLLHLLVTQMLGFCYGSREYHSLFV